MGDRERSNVEERSEDSWIRTQRAIEGSFTVLRTGYPAARDVPG